MLRTSALSGRAGRAPLALRQWFLRALDEYVANQSEANRLAIEEGNALPSLIKPRREITLNRLC